jgi:hypothetical protein
MKRIAIILFVTGLTTCAGLYFRPSFILIGQLDWFNVLTKGYFVGSVPKFFSQSFLDESFYFVMKFTVAGFLGGILFSLFIKSKAKKGAAKKKKA